MEVTNERLKAIQELHPGVEFRTYDATVGEGRHKPVYWGQVLVADDGTCWIADEAATGYRLARVICRRDSYGDIMQPLSLQSQSVRVRPATGEEVAAHHASLAIAAKAQQEKYDAAMAKDDFRCKAD